MRHQMGQQDVVDVAPTVHHEDNAHVFDRVLIQGRETSLRADPDVVERFGDSTRQRNADPEVEEDVKRRYDLTGVTLDPGHGDRYRDTVLTGVDLGSLEKFGVMGKTVDQSTVPGQLEVGSSMPLRPTSSATLSALCLKNQRTAGTSRPSARMPPNRSTTRASRPRRPLSPPAITPNALYPLPCPRLPDAVTP